MKKSTIMAVLAASMLASCATNNKMTSINALTGEWLVTEIAGSPVAAGDDREAPFIGFDTDKKMIYGSTGCNRLTGVLDADAKTGRIDLGKMGSTRMMCRDMATEQKVLEAMGKTAFYKIEKDGRLEFRDDSGKAVMVMKRK